MNDTVPNLGTPPVPLLNTLSSPLFRVFLFRVITSWSPLLGLKFITVWPLAVLWPMTSCKAICT